jgi:predicted PurR-regulated permease PerM
MGKIIKKLPRWVRLGLTFPLLFFNGVLLAFLINYLQPLINFLIIATILAFLLELLIEILQQKGVKRGIAIAIVLSVALVIMLVVGLILVPLMVQQLGDLIKNAPQWIEQTNNYFNSKLPLFERFNIDIDFLIAEVKAKIANLFQGIGSKTLDIAVATITNVLNTLFIIVLTVFLLIAGDKFWLGIFSWLPSPWQEKIPQYLQKTFKDYFFIRLILMGISSVVRTIIFVFLGVPYAILFAFSIGIANLVPFMGGIITIGGTLLLIFKSGKLALFFWLSATIIDQLTDNVLGPRLMGDAIGLNPIWLIISLFIGTKLGGLLGLFLAVPIASVIKQIVDELRSKNAPNSETISEENNTLD